MAKRTKSSKRISKTFLHDVDGSAACGVQ